MGGRIGGKSGKTPPMHSRIPQREYDILSFCREARSRAEIQKHLGLRDAKHLRVRYLALLVERGLLRLTEPANPTTNDQKYHLTNRGQSLLNEQMPQAQSTAFQLRRALSKLCFLHRLTASLVPSKRRPRRGEHLGERVNVFLNGKICLRLGRIFGGAARFARRTKPR